VASAQRPAFMFGRRQVLQYLPVTRAQFSCRSIHHSLAQSTPIRQNLPSHLSLSLPTNHRPRPTIKHAQPPNPGYSPSPHPPPHGRFDGAEHSRLGGPRRVVCGLRSRSGIRRVWLWRGVEVWLRWGDGVEGVWEGFCEPGL
jgi:hypothetical protein